MKGLKKRFVKARLLPLMMGCFLMTGSLQSVAAEASGAETADAAGLVVDGDIITDNPTADVTIEELANGEVWVDKSVYTGDITIDGHDFSTDEFLVQLTSAASLVSKNREPVDVVIALDETTSTQNAAYGFLYDEDGPNGTQDDFIMVLNEFIDILMNSNSENRIAVICYGSHNQFFKDTEVRMGSEPLYTLLELGHYTNNSWDRESPYTVTEGQGSIDDGTYLGGEIIEGKYISFYESGYENSVWDYLDGEETVDESYKALIWANGSNRKGYSYKVQTNEALLKDGILTEVNTFYGGVLTTGTANAILYSANYLKEHMEGDTAILIVLTDGVPNTINTDYTETLDFNDTAVTKKYCYPATNASGYTVWKSQSTSDASKIQSFNGATVDAAVSTIASAAYAKEQLREVYEEVFLYTISTYNSEYAECVLNPAGYASAADITNQTAYRLLEELFKNGNSVTLPASGIQITNQTGTEDYCYSDGYYYANDVDTLASAFDSLFAAFKGNACGEIMFRDTLGDDMEVKDIRGLIVDGVLYTDFVESEEVSGLYACKDLPGVTVSINEADGRQVVEYKVPESYGNSLMKLLFEEGIRDSFLFEKEGEYAFYSNDSCIVTYTKTEDNPYDAGDVIVQKTENKTGTADYVSKTTVSGNDVTVENGNCGLLTKVYKVKRSISGLAWLDANRNGIREEGERFFAGADMKLYRTDASACDASGASVASVNGVELYTAYNVYGEAVADITTGSDGAYLFEWLEPGTYYVVVSGVSDYLLTEKDVGEDDTVDSDADIDGEVVFISEIHLPEAEDMENLIYGNANNDIGLLEPVYSLKVSKTVTGNMGDKTKEFTFRLRLTEDKKGTVAVPESLAYEKETVSGTAVLSPEGTYDFTLCHGESIIFSEIPSGMVYEVTELDGKTAGYTVESVDASGTLNADKAVTFTNTKNGIIPTSADTNGRIILVLVAVTAAAAGVTGGLYRRRRKR